MPDTASTAPLLALTRVSKAFRLYASPADRLREALLRRACHRDHQALDGVSLEVRPGDAVGVIGRNGAGKSTLLKLVTGVLLPDAGTIRHAGRVTGLLELGTGFDPNLSGRDNIDINARLLGMGAADVRRKQDAIIAFSELGPFIDAPVRTYSSGMAMRLGFAIAIHADPDCFVVDEALSVGDARFQQKCIARIREFREQGGGILFVSHDVNAVKLVCNRAVVLEAGRLRFDGPPEQAVSRYFRLIAGVPAGMQMSVREGDGDGDYGQRRTRIVAATLHDGQGRDTRKFVCGDAVSLRLAVASDDDVALNVGFLLRDRFGQDIFGTNTGLLGRRVAFSRGTVSECRFDFPVRLAPGSYSVTLAVHSELTHLHNCQHWLDNALEFEVSAFGAHAFAGVCELPVGFSATPQRARDGAQADKEIPFAS
ncbi:ABC-type transporter, ATPase component, LPS efflux transporter [Cupriavidus taiwanensis]|uniref:ABC-type transporter, ATPase component, LPS efflux transporter n=1 Tax=Cupriavidus taiwanensis TaxID=164546 RepID=A0A375EB52_9BURK|nr:ABC transporter ATP-binding protein [Cupriavidus taiwanensis]SOZ67334.1 ABC-type transporter, ATPase component, LPS efflux transporter [Cupriavidus taiwanensis]SOZ68561.1 ABC-type transporter, ATPase component, LPS efflux transporter [Cupriavidus taiwanensis]SOZ71589.1 ABC-type transporter, ATPase component, LPS efflux transporter [Cupriavidus taiwanensis]SPA09394.1 ABC-type transporter, ATPase component, LPS efflux transporter [Cupriavidus taiwanensis]